MIVRLALAALVPSAAALSTGAAVPWSSLQAKLPVAPTSAPKLTFYRDTNGWCPFCERVWIALDKKGVEYDEVLINLQDKPQWFKDMVPTALVPAIKFADTEQVVWESLDIIKALDAREIHLPAGDAAVGSAATRLLPTPGDAAAEALHNANLALVDATLGAGFKFQYAFRNASLAADERAGLEANYKAALQALDDALALRGPCLGGATLAAADLALAPMMERNRWQLPATSPGFPFLDARPSPSGGGVGGRGAVAWPHLARWFAALDADPAYARRAAGDEISWLTTTSTFLRLFGGGPNGTAPSAEVVTKMHHADDLAAAALRRAAAAATSKRAAIRRVGRRWFLAFTAPWAWLSRNQGAGRSRSAPSDAALAAAAKVLANRAAVVADAAAATGAGYEPKSQKALARLPVNAAPSVDLALFNTCARLLGVPPPRGATEQLDQYADPLVAAAACEYLAARVCAPRDMGAGAAREFRAALFQEAAAAKRQAKLAKTA